MIAWVDGEWVEESEGRVPIGDRGFLYGDGVYDTCRLYDGRWLRFEEHARRLHESAAVLGIRPPPVPELAGIADALRDRNARIGHGVLRITVTRGSENGRGHGHRLVMTLKELPADWRERARRGWSCITAETRHPPPSVMPPRLKGQGRVFSLLARREAEAAGCDQALLLSVGGQITEGATWNVFWRTGEVVRTPHESTGLLAGVTRAVVMECVPGAGFRLETGVWERAELDDADEVFGTMTSLGIVPIHRLDGRSLPEPRVAVDALTPLYWERVRGG
ncbi:MAG: aminotransferase class IV [Gemmatimonadota bacterium]